MRVESALFFYGHDAFVSMVQKLDDDKSHSDVRSISNRNVSRASIPLAEAPKWTMEKHLFLWTGSWFSFFLFNRNDTLHSGGGLQKVLD